MWLGLRDVPGFDDMSRWAARVGRQDAGLRGCERSGMARRSVRRWRFGPSIARAGRGPAAQASSIGTSCSRERHHDVSILISLDGRMRGVAPRSKVSMMIMRPPQHGHGWESIGGSPASASAGSLFVAGRRSRSRTWAMFSARPPPATVRSGSYGVAALQRPRIARTRHLAS